MARKRQKKAEEAIQKRPVQEIEMEASTTPPAPSVKVPDDKSDLSHVTVLEHGLEPDEPLLYERLEALVDKISPGDILYLTVPRSMAGDTITSWLLAHFARIGPLNVGTNPQLRNNDPRMREGFMCVK
jgi:hypothetical protein